MKEINTIDEHIIYHVMSEPGDNTRYEYFVYVNEFCFMPAYSKIRFPQRLNYYEVKPLLDKSEKSLVFIEEIAEKEQCNPYTTLECIRTVVELYEKKK